MATERLGFAALQLALIAALARYATGSGATWTYIAFLVASPLLLALSYWGGRSLRRRNRPAGTRAMRAFTGLAQGATLVLLVLSLLVAPLALFGALVFGGMD